MDNNPFEILCRPLPSNSRLVSSIRAEKESVDIHMFGKIRNQFIPETGQDIHYSGR